MDNIQFRRTDSTTLTKYNNKCCIVISPLKMSQKIKVIENDLKLRLKNINK